MKQNPLNTNNYDSVNEIFNPEKVDELYALPADIRSAAIRRDKDTNYGVVRIELLERLYESLYAQRLRYPNEKDWRHKIIPLTDVAGVLSESQTGRMRIRMKNVRSGIEGEEDFDAVIVATGYVRNEHQKILNIKNLLKRDSAGQECWSVGRDYKLQHEEGSVAANAGIWLQGCNEITHGVSTSESQQ